MVEIKYIGHYEYKRPNFIKSLRSRERILKRLNNKIYPTESLYNNWCRVKDYWDFYYTLCSIGLTKFNSDGFWIEEINFFSDSGIILNQKDKEITNAFLQRGRVGELTKYIGKLAVKRLKSKIHNHQKTALEIAEYRSIQDWIQYRDSLKFQIKGKRFDIHSLFDNLLSTQRDIRKESYEMIKNSFSNDYIDNIMTRLVHLRDEISKSCNFENYEEFIESQSFRDWGSKEATEFKDAIKKYIVPIISSLQKSKKKRLNISKLEDWDEHIFWRRGNPKLCVSKKMLIKQYLYVIDSIFGEDITQIASDMFDNNFIDIELRKNKDVGAYCWSIDGTNESFISIKLQNTNDEPETFFHEFGHSLQFYFSGDYYIHELRKSTRELIEIPSITLELFLQDYFELFYGQKAREKKELHLINLLTLICKVCILDDWQRNLYKNPNWTIKERNKSWADAERTWSPWRKVNPERWKQDYTIFETPFYDLDYGIATICALQLWIESKTDKESSMKKYLMLCEMGGKKNLYEAMKSVKLKNPFDENTIKWISEELTIILKDY
jgi:M3 family oligoendopeptidase